MTNVTIWQPAIILRHFLRPEVLVISWMFPRALQRLSARRTCQFTSAVIFLRSVRSTDFRQNWKCWRWRKTKTAKYRAPDINIRVTYFISSDFSEGAFEYIVFLRNQRWIKMHIKWILSGQAHHKNNTRKNWKVIDSLTPRKQSNTVVPNMQVA